MKFTPGLLRTHKPAHPLLGAAVEGYRPPTWIDSRSQVLPPSDQGTSAQCVAYALAGLIEFARWRDRGEFKQIDPAPIYARAKKLDGMPGEDGTTLEAALQAAQDLGLLSAVAQESIKSFDTAADLKRAVHRYGVVLTAFNATEGWLHPGDDGWVRPGGAALGGHAVLMCAYDEVETPPFFGFQDNYGMTQGWRGFCRMSPEQLAEEFIYGMVWQPQ